MAEMKKFKVIVTEVSEFEIDIDENIWTKSEIESWSKSLYPADGPKEIAEHLATAIVNYGTGQSMEGFGYVQGFYNNGAEVYHRPESKLSPGISYCIETLSDKDITSEEL